jgi:nitrogen fixation-related uncharacterized protein
MNTKEKIRTLVHLAIMLVAIIIVSIFFANFLN